MYDSRVERLADILTGHSTEIKPGDKVYLLTDSTLGLPLFEVVYRKVIERGAYPYPHILLDPNVGFEGMDDAFMRYASDEQLQHMSEIALAEMQAMDAYIRIGAPENTRSLSGIDPKRIAMRQKATASILHERLRKRWVVTRYPTPALAQEANMSLKDYEDFFFGAVLVDYIIMEQQQRSIKTIFDTGSSVKVVATDTDLTFSIAGREGRMSYGKHNVPDGEVYYAPVESSANGVVRFTYPAIESGNEVRGVRLTFRDGVVVEATSDTNETFLLGQLDTDSGSRKLGEFGIGLNYGIDRFTGNMLFDEKIGGSIHLALGNAYEGTAPEGVRNKSGLHWDMLVDLRESAGGGKLYLDGKVIQENGVFKIE
ncbi:MAG: aminopeptidase [Candidatus Aenigmarchaeota archaeon]|nr:aminopeptidase [Candidatus Aenigmarchaeota archaeon]